MSFYFVPFDKKRKKPELYEIIKSKKQPPIYKVDDFLKIKGHEIIAPLAILQKS
jgi:hypothetical protein